MGKTKGSAVLSAVKLLRRNRAEALTRLPPRLHHYLEDRIVVASWYPEEDSIALIAACAAVLNLPSDSVFETMGALAARDHLEGVYADLLHRPSTTRSRTLWKTQHDTGALSVTGETPNSVTYELVGWGHASTVYCRLLNGYFAEVHRLAGEARPVAHHPVCRCAGGDRCVWTVSWDAPSAG